MTSRPGRDSKRKSVSARSRIAMLIAASAVLAACGTGAATSQSKTSNSGSSSKSRKPAGSGASNSKQSTSSQTGRCRSSQLSVHLLATEGAAGSVIRSYSFVNTGSTSCTLFGYPGLQLLGSSNSKLSTTVIRTPAAEQTVTLKPGQAAGFSMRFADQTGFGSLQCPTSVSLEVTPPNAYNYVTVTGQAGQIQAYGGTTQNLKCGEIDVKPVVAIPS